VQRPFPVILKIFINLLGISSSERMEPRQARVISVSILSFPIINNLGGEQYSDIVVSCYTGGEVSWQYMSSKDGTQSGYDSDEIWYLKDAINLYVRRIEKQRRTSVFWTGGANTDDDSANVDQFIEIDLAGQAVVASTVFPHSDFTYMGFDDLEEDGRWWRAINRMSKALAAGANNGRAYVYMNNNNCRTIFSPPSQNPQDVDPAHGGQATNGEIFYYAELPMLMRNLNIQQIITFSKVDREFVQNIEWDVNRVWLSR